MQKHLFHIKHHGLPVTVNSAFLDRRNEYQPKGWGVKAGMVRV